MANEMAIHGLNERASKLERRVEALEKAMEDLRAFLFGTIDVLAAEAREETLERTDEQWDEMRELRG